MLACLTRPARSSRCPSTFGPAADACTDAVAAAPNCKITSTPLTRVRVEGDADQLRQAIANPSPTPWAHARRHRHRGRHAVEDGRGSSVREITGPASPARTASGVFDRFWRAGRVPHRDGGRPGPVDVVAITAAHGGEASADNVPATTRAAAPASPSASPPERRAAAARAAGFSNFPRAERRRSRAASWGHMVTTLDAPPAGPPPAAPPGPHGDGPDARRVAGSGPPPPVPSAGGARGGDRPLLLRAERLGASRWNGPGNQYYAAATAR